MPNADLDDVLDQAFDLIRDEPDRETAYTVFKFLMYASRAHRDDLVELCEVLDARLRLLQRRAH